MENMDISEISFGKSLAQTAIVAVVASAATMTGMLIAGYGYSKFIELQEAREAKKLGKK